MTIFSKNRCHLWIDRNQAWFELWVNWDYHNYIVSITILTIEIGWEWVWVKSRPTIKKDSRQIVWYK